MSTSTRSSITSTELRAMFSLSAILSTRLFGLFMILPIFSVYAHKFHGNTPTLLGIALGIYGLFQAILQMPFGILSDKFGRKPIITLGLIIFALGSVVAALSTSIYGVIIGRALQGCGAIGSAVTAFLADLVRPEHRTKAMAILGMTIGLSFTVAMVLGPLLSSWIQISGIFWFTAGLALCSIALLWMIVPSATVHMHTLPEAEPLPRQFKAVLLNGDLLRLDFGIFILQAILTASFIAIPIILQQLPGFQAKDFWYLYLLALVLSFLIMMPLIILAERFKKLKWAVLGSIMLLIVSELLLLKLPHTLLNIVGSLIIFATAFNILEATLPSLASKIAPANHRGSAMGVFSSSQYFGIFIGGIVGGWIMQYFRSVSGIFLFCAIISAVWLLLAVSPYRTKTTPAIH